MFDESYNDYYIWLCDFVDLRSHREYSKLIRTLFDIDFYWIIRNDSNRAEDGKDLRWNYINEEGLGCKDDSWADENCSVLEMLIALARRIRVDIMPDFDIEIDDWFWIFLENLELLEFDNRHFSRPDVDYIVSHFLERDCSGGVGLLFFSKNLTKKQLESTELWYLMQFWLAENYEI